MKLERPNQFRPGSVAATAFTLFELLLAVAIFAIVLAAINTVFYSALRLRTKVADAIDKSHELNQALSFLRRDLRGIIPPGIVLAGPLKIGPVSSGIGLPENPGIEFYTTTGVISDYNSWGDIQKVTYQLREPADRTEPGQDLIRSVTRNLLATSIEPPEEQWLLGGIDNLQFLCFNGTEWRDTWDTTLGDTGSPLAIRVSLQLASDATFDIRNRQPIELLVPLMAQAATNQTQTTTGGQP